MLFACILKHVAYSIHVCIEHIHENILFCPVQVSDLILKSYKFWFDMAICRQICYMFLSYFICDMLWKIHIREDSSLVSTFEHLKFTCACVDVSVYARRLIEDHNESLAIALHGSTWHSILAWLGYKLSFFPQLCYSFSLWLMFSLSMLVKLLWEFCVLPTGNCS